jgi:hypothetical protein
MCVFTNCANIRPVKGYKNDDIKLIINAEKDVFLDSFNIMISIENNTDSNITLLDNELVTTTNNKAYIWNLQILFNDTMSMVSPCNFFSRLKPITKDDYFILKSGDKYTFDFDIDFTELVHDPINFGMTNENYGVYFICLSYYDSYRKNKNAVQGVIKSNIIKLLYAE